MKDFYSDYGYNYIKLFQNREVPSFVEDAESLEPEKVASLPDSAFGHPDSRTFPLVDKGNVYVSAAYYYGANDKNASVEDRILKAAELFGISEAVTSLRESICTGSAKTASVSEDKPWSVNIKRADESNRIFEGESPESLVKFARAFVYDLFPSFEFSEKVDCAKQIAEKMAEYNLDIPERILQVAGLNIPDTEKVAHQIKARAVRIPEDRMKTALCKIADDFAASTNKDMAGMFKLAEMLDTVDKDYSLQRFYGRSIQDPFASVFNTPREVAEKLATEIDLGGDSYSYTELLEVPLGILKAALSEESAKLVGVGTENFDPSKLAKLGQEERSLLGSYL